MNCWYCGEKMIWQSDFTLEDMGRKGEGIVSILCCSKCNAVAEFSIRDEDEADEEGLHKEL